MRFFSKQGFFLILLLVVGFFLRIWRLEEFFVFGFDEEVIAFRAKQLLANYKPFLIGGVTPFHIHLGPLFYYFSAFLLIWPWFLNPLSWGVWAAVIASGVIFLIYQVGSKLFNHRVGLLAAFFQSLSFYQILYDRHYWPLFLNPLFSLLVLLSLWQIVHKKINWVFVLSAILAFTWQTDPSSWLLFVLVLVAWRVFSLPLKKKKVIFAFLIFLASFLPLIIFDLRHQGSNIGGVREFQGKAGKSFSISSERLLPTLLFLPQGLARLLWTKTSDQAFYQRFVLADLNPALLALTIIVVLLLFSFFKKSLTRKKPGESLLALFYLITFIGVFLYGNLIGFDLWNHYLCILFPVFLLTVAWFFDRWWQGQWYLLVPLFLTAFLGFNLRGFLLYKPPFNFSNKIAAVAWTKEVLGEEEFSLESLSQDFRFNGIRYLFYLAGKEPVISFVDPPLFWLYDKEPGGQYPENFVVFVSHDFSEDSEEDQLYQQYHEETIMSQTFEDMEVLIVNNENREFTINY